METYGIEWKMQKEAHRYSYLIFDKDAENTHWRKDSHFIKYREDCISTCRRLKLDSYL
jgi:hypothetical protein